MVIDNFLLNFWYTCTMHFLLATRGQTFCNCCEIQVAIYARMKHVLDMFRVDPVIYKKSSLGFVES